jgi:holo-[acyl-carrier protein] synthase
VRGRKAQQAGCVVDTGIDALGIARVAELLERRPGALDRLLRSEEQAGLADLVHPQARAASVAGRIAVKEAAMKTLQGGIWDLGFLNFEIVGGRRAAPRLVLHDRAAVRAKELGIDEVKVSLSHEGDVAVAMATAVRFCSCNP